MCSIVEKPDLGRCNIYGPPPKCKKNRLRREQSAKMYPGLWVERNLRGA
jgi:hypothetical protein